MTTIHSVLDSKNMVSLDLELGNELFNYDQIEEYGSILATEHHVSQKCKSGLLLKKLARSEQDLNSAFQILTTTPANNLITPAGEWLLDNFYLIEEHIRIIKYDLPRGYEKSLPQLENKIIHECYPRVYDIAQQLIKHSNGRWDKENLSRYIHAYQSIMPLTMGELWAIPIMLRLALIENLSLVSAQIIDNFKAYQLANYSADQLEKISSSDAHKLVLVFADITKSELFMTPAFVAELTRSLQNSALALPLTWIEQKLAQNELTIEELVQQENTQQATQQATFSQSIASLRRLNEVDWRDFVEEMSVVEEILRRDPSDTYSNMDFMTRDRYRHVVEGLARKIKCSESVVATAAIQLAKTSENHVGYYLIDNGLPQLQQALKMRISFWEKLRKWNYDRALFCYMGLIFLLVGGLTTTLLFKANQSSINTVELIILGIVLVLCISQTAISLVNWAVMLFIKPNPLPRMDFTKEIPSSCRTLVVVPSMLSSIAQIESLVEALEVRFLGNRNEHLHFALLTDFNDAAHEHMLKDEDLLTFAAANIRALNQQYSREHEDIFFLLHRPRLWNASEHVWMGHERKRGKLCDLNGLLRKGIPSNFSLIVGRSEILSQVKYIITLDTDTQLPLNCAQQLIATMAHPLNRPIYDPIRKCVVAGYGILQPRVAEALPNSGITHYLRLCSNESGIDPYTRTVSDVYQDLFGEGSFIGKGIYDVDMFQQVLYHRFPENHILSHDLLEGCYLRSGFLSDVPLYETSPPNFLTDVKRRIRWIRGDWQLINWLWPKIINHSNSKEKNPLSALSKWKVFDNLRRSLVPIALLSLLVLSWTLLPTSFFWLSIIAGIILLPGVVAILVDLMRKPKEKLLSQHFSSTIQIANKHFYQLILYLGCLPYEAWFSFCAITRTCWRLTLSHRHLLEWTPSDQIDQSFHDALTEWIAKMWSGPILALGLGTFLTLQRPDALLLAAPLLLLWMIAPVLMFWMSRPLLRKKVQLSTSQLRFLHIMARKTWDFFDTFVTAKDNWLPPDNYQESPVEVLCHRTSPTNIGLALLSNLSAYDFGYINAQQLLERTANTLQTLFKLERYRGHFYNWYDTHTLAALHPRYVSTVDGGNLAGHLLTLRQGLLALADESILKTRYLEGLEDTLDVLVENISLPQPEAIKKFRDLLVEAKASFTTWKNAQNYYNQLCEIAEEIITLWPTVNDTITFHHHWSQKLRIQCYTLRNKINLFSENFANLNPNITLREIILLPDDHMSLKQYAQERLDMLEKLAAQIFELAQMDVSFLYDKSRRLMSIGYNVDNQKKDTSYYDLLSSEARLANYVAIVQGQVPQESWFALGRLQIMTKTGQSVMMSWSGSMFEYLMPLLVMPSYSGTLLDQVYQTAVQKHIDYGNQRGVPWGFSESGYHALDTHANYLYRAFGVPELGFKRGLAEDLVVAPYASVMALMVTPEEACNNLQRLVQEGYSGKFGFYEAIDFTPKRLPRNSSGAVIRSFMAHHEGMSLLSFSYLLHNQPMQKRFIADPLFKSALLLLQERIPKPVASYFHTQQSAGAEIALPEPVTRIFNHADTNNPQVQLLSNGRYHVMLTQAGSGYSRWKDIAVTRWREDSTCDSYGLFSYVHDVKSGAFWSTNYQPTQREPESFQAIFSEGHAEFTRVDAHIKTKTEIVVSPEDDVELRRIRIYNLSNKQRIIEFTTYAEVVLGSQANDQAQPAFSNLFVETELLKTQNTILVTRRSSETQGNAPFMFHKLNVYSEKSHQISFETKRANFIGRGCSPAMPTAMTISGELSNTAGTVLDPIVAIRCRVILEPHTRITLDLITGVTDNRDQSIAFVEKYHDRYLTNRIFQLAGTYTHILLHQLNISMAEAKLYTKLASYIIYANNTYRADPNILASNRYGQSKLWGYSISGDLPIILLQISDVKNIDLVRQLVLAQSYWRRKGLLVDIVILNEEQFSYRQILQDQIMNLISAKSIPDHNGDIYLHVAEQMPEEDRILLQSLARVVLSDKNGTLKQQLNRRSIQPVAMPMLNSSPIKPSRNTIALTTQELQFYNGLGGFTSDGKEYIISQTHEKTTPMPWSNILANPNFGTLISESGQGYTWIENAHEFRLTPWNNDPVEDSAGEAFYVRDDETGQFWSPAALPCRGNGEYKTRHGFGYSIFEHVEEGINSELTMYVALDAPIKFMVLKVRNDSSRARKLSVMGYVEWVLGDLRSKNSMHVVTEISSTGALLAQNHYNADFGDRTAFFDAFTSMGLNARTVTGSRKEFIGRNRNQQTPMALNKVRLSGLVGAGLDPCGAIHLTFDLAQNQTREIVFILGAGQNKTDAETIVQRYQGMAAATAALVSIKQYWQNTLNNVQVKTPDVALDYLANGWLLYQIISSRLWGRTGYYQSSGAFGFRDQLQDTMALVHTQPELFRAQLLLCASRQFVEGDAQHWWHPPQGRGVRTRCSDDFLWLPFAICRYVETTGDMTLLNEEIAFLQGRPLKPFEESYYELPSISNEKATLYQHGVRAILHGLEFGEHGLPLMGSGDWNDGMNLVGAKGRGESVWLGFFLYTVLKHFAKLARQYGDNTFADRCDIESKQLQDNIEDNAWDGDWYRRAYFDNGTPLGSANNTECRIDSIAQSWSVLSTAAKPTRAKQAIASLNRYLVRPQDRLIALLNPPFNKSVPNPGYIEGYVPGIRENGGQYSHAAAWAIMAFVELGEIERAWQLFNMINPIHHGNSESAIHIYKIEPYVMAGDVYSVAPHNGRGGWSWYTGSAGWVYRLILESLLGIQLEQGTQLRLTPHLPKAWDSFIVEYRYKETHYTITISRGVEDKTIIILDGMALAKNIIPLVDDHQSHLVSVIVSRE